MYSQTKKEYPNILRNWKKWLGIQLHEQQDHNIKLKGFRPGAANGCQEEPLTAHGKVCVLTLTTEFGVFMVAPLKSCEWINKRVKEKD